MSVPTSKCESPAHFFKYIPPGSISDRKLMSIPKSFRKYLKSSSKNITAKLTRGCHKWPVKIDDDWAFGEGWEDFVRENDVQDCDIVVFKHEGNMVFEIMLFDLTWCEKEYPTHDHVTEDVAEKAECSGAKSYRKSQFDTTWNETPKQNETYKNNSTESLHKAKKMTIPYDDNQHPYFTGTVKSEYDLYLPTSFTMPNELSEGEMILKNGQTKAKRSWTVNLKCSFRNSYHITRGWNDFYIANGLKKGDTIKLELIKNGIKPEANFYRLPKETTIKGMVVKNPCFKSTVTSFRIANSYVNIPMKFARSNGLFSKNCESVVMDEKERLWTTTICSTNKRVHLKGIQKVWAANGLVEGDDFFLELVDNGMKPLINFYGMKKTDVGG